MFSFYDCYTKRSTYFNSYETSLSASETFQRKGMKLQLFSAQKKIQQAVIQGLNEDLIVLTTSFEWSLVSKMELASSKTVSGTNVLLLDYKHFE